MLQISRRVEAMRIPTLSFDAPATTRTHRIMAAKPPATKSTKSSHERHKLALLRYRFAAVCASLAVSFLVMEVTLRLNEHAPPPEPGTNTNWGRSDDGSIYVRADNPRIVFKLRPNIDMYVPFFERTIRTNSHGFRDREVLKEKPNDVFRIAFVGDSITFGWNLDADAVYPRLVEANFREDGYRVESLNMSVGGYNIDQETALIAEDVLEFHPDLIVIGYVLNDNEIGADAGVWHHFTRTWCRTYDWISLRVARIRQNWRESVYGETLTSIAFQQLEAISRETSTPIMVVIFPYLEERLAFAYGPTHSVVQSLASKHDFETVDLWEPFHDAGFDRLRLNSHDVIHPNQEGNRIAARKICDRIMGDEKMLTELQKYRDEKAGQASPEE